MTDRRMPHNTVTPRRRRRRHPAIGSRIVATTLSIGAAVGLMTSMGIADARSTTDASEVVLAPPPVPVVRVAARPTVLLPVPTSSVSVAPATTTTTTTTVPAATPQPIQVKPKPQVVTVKSNGSK